MKNIVILQGSIRKGGNTEILVNSFADGARKNNNVEIISVQDYHVNPCIGCEACFKSNDNRCVIDDDMQKIYPKLRDADIIVIASPVYFYGISAQLKAIIDRLHTPFRNTFKVKKLGLLLVAGAPYFEGLFESIKVQYQLVLDYFKLESIGEVLVSNVRGKGEIKGNEALDKAYDLGKNIL